jgi:hypothetical protein
VVGNLWRLRQGPDPRKSPPDNAKIDGGDGEASEDSGRSLMTSGQHPSECCRPAERQRTMRQRGGDEQRFGAGFIRQD